ALSGYPGMNRLAVALAPLLLVFFLITPLLAPPPGRAETMKRCEIRANLSAHLEYLSVRLGERSIYRPNNLKAAEDYVFARATPTCAGK
ncbi:MAG: hypothetical protein NTW80_08120, partial [Deltaproteobacteria bacterium]|nr:hypothetical protein [Deltaproteobacteria bacterium]